jgi:hypothetical protein
MASRIKHIVEPVVGWLFIVAVIIAIGAALLAATQPMVELTGQLRVEKAH